MKARIPVLLLAVAAASCGYKPAREASWASLPAYAFPHSTHVDADVACANCHDMTKATALDASVRHVRIPADVPKQKACGDCHDSQPKFQVPARDRPYHVRINHAEHLPRVNGDCKRCHAKQPETGDTAAVTPPMKACTSCHHHQLEYAQARCRLGMSSFGSVSWQSEQAFCFVTFAGIRTCRTAGSRAFAFAMSWQLVQATSASTCVEWGNT